MGGPVGPYHAHPTPFLVWAIRFGRFGTFTAGSEFYSGVLCVAYYGAPVPANFEKVKTTQENIF
jgi:hypothetical protein